jgi:hypothetical protein
LICLQVTYIYLGMKTIVLIMEINYTIAGPVLIAVAALIIFLIRRNNKDKKQLEKEIIDSEIKPEKHDD